MLREDSGEGELNSFFFCLTRQQSRMPLMGGDVMDGTDNDGLQYSPAAMADCLLYIWPDRKLSLTHSETARTVQKVD